MTHHSVVDGCSFLLFIFSFFVLFSVSLIHCLTLQDQHPLFACQVFILHTYLFFPVGSTWLNSPFSFLFFPVEPSQRFRCCPPATCRHIWMPDFPLPQTTISSSKEEASSLLGNIFPTEMESASVHMQITHFFVSQDVA